MSPFDRILFETPNIRVGAFRCPTGAASFRNTGPTEGHIVVFPRTSVWIRHAGSRTFLADQRVATIYNQGQEYTRTEVAPDGDRSDWYGVSPALAAAMMDHLGFPVESPDRPWRAEYAVSDPGLYLLQRQVFTRLEAGGADPLWAEEAVIGIVAEVLRRGHAPSVSPLREARKAREVHRDLAHRARAELAARVAEPTDVTRLAARLGVSPFHLCRVFRAQTGMTLHAYRLDLRLRRAMELVVEPRTDLSRVALELGFSSHSHFTATLRTRLGRTPSALRQELLGRAS